MTISFSYAYLNGLLRLMVRGRSDSRRSASSSAPSLRCGCLSPPVVMAVQRATREMSPRRTVSTVKCAQSASPFED